MPGMAITAGPARLVNLVAGEAGEVEEEEGGRKVVEEEAETATTAETPLPGTSLPAVDTSVSLLPEINHLGAGTTTVPVGLSGGSQKSQIMDGYTPGLAIPRVAVVVVATHHPHRYRYPPPPQLSSKTLDLPHHHYYHHHHHHLELTSQD